MASTQDSEQERGTAALAEECGAFCPKALALLSHVVQSATTPAPVTAAHPSNPTSSAPPPWLSELHDLLKTNALLGLALSDEARRSLVSATAAVADVCAPPRVLATTFDVLDRLLSAAPVSAIALTAQEAKALVPTIHVAVQKVFVCRNDLMLSRSAAWYLFSLLALAQAQDVAGGPHEGGGLTSTVVAALLSAVATVVMDATECSPPSLGPAELAGVADTLALSTLALAVLNSARPAARGEAAGACKALESAVAAVMEKVHHGQHGVLVAVACVAHALSYTTEGSAGALFRTAMGKCDSGDSAAERAQSKDGRDSDEGAMYSLLGQLSKDGQQDATTTTTEGSGADSSAADGARPLLVQLRNVTEALKIYVEHLRCDKGNCSSEGCGDERGACPEYPDLLGVFEQLHDAYGGASILAAAVLTPDLLSCLCELLHLCSSAEPACEVPADSGNGQPKQEPPLAAVLDLWLALLLDTSVTPSLTTGPEHGHVDVMVSARGLLTQVFLLTGGIEKLVNWLSWARPKPTVAESASADSNAAGLWHGQLLSAWHLLEAVTLFSASSCARAVFSADAPRRALVPLVQHVASMEGEAEVQALFAAPACVEVLATVLALVPPMTAGCVHCFDGPSADDRSDGATSLSHAAERIFGDAGNDLVSAVATVVSIAGATGCASVVTAGVEAMVVLACGFPYAATRAVDFDFLTESMELWQVAAAAAAEADKSDDKAAERGALLTVRDCLTLGTFRIMEALARRVPQAIDFEWIVFLQTAIALLSYHRSGSKGSNEGDSLPLRDAFALAVLPSALASVLANEEAAEYLFEEDTQQQLWLELRERNREAASASGASAGTVKRVSATVVSGVLSLATLFPPGSFHDEQRGYVEELLPGNGEAWYSAAVPLALAQFMESVASQDVSSSEKDGQEAGVAAEGVTSLGTDAFVARLICSALDGTSSTGVSNVNAGTSVANLIRVLHCQGASAAAMVAQTLPASPPEADRNRFLTRLLFLVSALQTWSVCSPGCAWPALWNTVSTLAVSVVRDLVESDLKELAAFAVPAKLLYAKHCLTLMEAAATLPPVVMASCLPEFVVQDERRCCHSTQPDAPPSFISSLSCACERYCSPVDGGHAAATTTAPSVTGALEESVFSMVGTLLTQSASSSETLTEILGSTGWHTFVTRTVLPRFHSARCQGTLEETLLTYLSIVEVRRWFLDHEKDAYAGVLQHVEAFADLTAAELRVKVYKDELTEGTK